MAKEKSVYICNHCGYQSSSYLGKCPECESWGSFEQVAISNNSTQKKTTKTNSKSQPIPIHQVIYKQENRIDTFDKELNRVLGGGLVLGSVVLIGGEPGIGKSTLLLQTALSLNSSSVLYVSGEESPEQIKLRQVRMNINSEKCLLLSENNVENIIETAQNINPSLLIVDSIQTLTSLEAESFAGSITQIRICADKLIDYAKSCRVPIILVGHITKDGSLAGPKILEHMVDTVLQFEGDKNYGYRILRSIKNRFGSTNEIGIYEMTSFGLKAVENPSQILMTQRDENLSGISTCATMEGRRSLLIETQALVSPSYYSSPQRVSNGFDIRRLNMLLAVLEKKAGVKVSNKDVFLNIAGGIKVSDPAIDISVVASILSSHQDVYIDKHSCFAAEVGLSGEIRPVPYIDRRIKEAENMGFKKIYLSKYNKDVLETNVRIKPVYLANISDLINNIMV
ncbi:MAG: DNA repair protein RadA [Bacteroidota bacterium]|nr:DNA repair protein RadA [Bacteroidota bacterium]